MFEVRTNSLNSKSTDMKKIMKHFSRFPFFVLPASVLLFCSWQEPKGNHYSDNGYENTNRKDTVPGKIDKEYDLNMKELDKAMDNLNIQMKNLNLNFDKQFEALSKINFDEIEKQTEASLKAIDWNKMQQDVNISLQNAQKEIAQIDFSKMQNDFKKMQDKLQSEAFKSQFNTEKMQKEIAGAMSKAKESIEKAKEKLQQMKNFTDELAADGLIDKKKGYTIEWKNGSLFINGKQQPKDISDKYRKYEDEDEIKMLPEGAERF